MWRATLKRILSWITDKIAPVLRDSVTGEVLGRVWVFVWGGKIRVVGLRKPARVAWAPRSEVRYWWHDLEFRTVPEERFPAEGAALSRAASVGADDPQREVLWVVLTHRGEEHYQRLKQVWDRVGGTVLWVWGGEKGCDSFLPADRRVWVEDSWLRTRFHPVERQSYLGVWQAVSRWMEGQPWGSIGFFEDDHLPLAANLGCRLKTMLLTAQGDVIFHRLRQIDGTNSSHLLTHRLDPQFETFWREVSVRRDGTVIWEALVTGSFWRREAWDAVAHLQQPMRIYLEIFLPTAAHHLGWRVRGFDARESRWVGVVPWKSSQVQEAREAGVTGLHPLKPSEWSRIEPFSTSELG